MNMSEETFAHEHAQGGLPEVQFLSSQLPLVRLCQLTLLKRASRGENAFLVAKFSSQLLLHLLKGASKGDKPADLQMELFLRS
jgi:hypothetical protein